MRAGSIVGRVDKSRFRLRGDLQARIGLAFALNEAISPKRWQPILVPKGTIVYEGFAAPQAGLIGGGSQVFISSVNPAWLIK